MTEKLEGYERYHQFMDKLTENNVDEYIDLPMIAVMGDTSSGKSSLLSNISLVELPSADCLTTRCPIMLKMHHDEIRSATVKVSWKDRPEGEGVDFAERKIEEENWNSITSAIADAQAHIIQKSKKQVARDIVSVDMRGPHCEDLTLIDLPGIVRTSGKDESATLAGDIHGLMNDYLVNPRCVILAVLPCNVDFHNSQILAEAKKVDPETKRTIPVLTKPDLIDGGGESSVKKLLLGMETESFCMGFHMVKGRGQAALDKNEALRKVSNMKNHSSKTTNPGEARIRTSLLAGLQMEIIRSSFKDIVSDLKSQRDSAVTSYQALGNVPSDSEGKRALFRSIQEEIWKGISTKTLDGYISSLHRDSKMRHSAKFHEASRSFQDALNSSKLANISDVAIGTKIIAIHSGKEVCGEVCFIDEEKDHVFIKNFVAKKGVNSASFIKKGEPGNIIQKGSKVYIELEDGTVDQLYSFELKFARPDPEWLSDLIKQNRPYKLPIFINTSVFDAIVADLIAKDWAQPTMDLLDCTTKLMNHAAEEFIKELKQTASYPSLQNVLVIKASEVVEHLTRDTRGKIEEFVTREQVPYTQNHYLFENVCKLRSQRLMDEVLSVLPQGTPNVNSLASTVTLPTSLASTVKNVFSETKRVDDHMAEEMQNALNSYGKVALKRFIDNVPMICVEIMQKFADKMNDILSKTTDEEIERFVVAPPNTVDKINKLKRKGDTLDKGIAALSELF
ncbi:LOW QUALITY PROTEIN: hypothetical protein ACHAXR_008639 [Thalassiosira sp. AJA248-18]